MDEKAHDPLGRGGENQLTRPWARNQGVNAAFITKISDCFGPCSQVLSFPDQVVGSHDSDQHRVYDKHSMGKHG